MTGKERVKFLYIHANLEATIAQALEEKFLDGEDREKLVLLQRYRVSFNGLHYTTLTKNILLKYIGEKES